MSGAGREARGRDGSGIAGAAEAPAPPPALSIRASVPERGLDVDVDVSPGEVLAVLGRNGAGKSSLVGLGAGLLRPGAGTVRIGGRVVADAGTWVPPRERGVAFLAQRPLLFPHLDVLANVAFGPRSAGTPRRDADEVARRALAAVEVGDLAGRRPRELSGGQAQRVALARALAPDPRVVLLDEPLAALDVESATAMRRLLRRAVRDSGRTALLVTHDVLDVLALADAVVVLEDGRVVERGAALDVLTRPRSSFAASLAGLNLVRGTLRDGALDAGGTVLRGVVDPACRPGDEAAAAFGPRTVTLHRERPAAGATNAVAAHVTSLEHQGELVRVVGTTAGGHTVKADLTPASLAAATVTVGDHLVFAVSAAEVTIYPA
ncbi:ABC transporter ATP-binding protein [Georgenia wangjunii]|uniref:ABC transporter ATP-binding protein n=1 Tax=Georgenia wangjunii TaxID=3117730 RepID=UPI002F263268